MYNKGIIASALIAFVGVQFASTLQCYTCTSFDNCKTLQLENCSSAVATATSSHLAYYNSEVANISDSEAYKCLQAKYINTESTNDRAEVWLFGCVYREISPCNLVLKPIYKLSYCGTCMADKCYPANTAGIPNFDDQIETTGTTIGTSITDLTTKTSKPPPPLIPSPTIPITTTSTRSANITTTTPRSITQSPTYPTPTTPSTTSTTDSTGTAGTYRKSQFLIIASIVGLLLTNRIAQPSFI